MLPTKLIDYLNQGECVLFVGDAFGDGDSPSARLIAALVEAGGAYCEDCAAQRRCQHPTACKVPLSHAAQVYEAQYQRPQLINLVSRSMDNARAPGPVHHALAALPVRAIISTALDDRLEAALEAQRRSVLRVVRDVDVPFGDPNRVQVIRLHGTISQPDSLVLTENDAADLMARLSSTIGFIVQAHIATKTLLFVGYRLEDFGLRQLYRQVTQPIARFKRPAYAVQWLPSPQLEASWQGQITFISGEPLQILDQLARSVQAQPVVPVAVERPPLPPEPYKFLDYFTEQDAAIFFGRDLEAGLLLSRILSRPMTVFYGRSGTGKTSLLLARVGPELQKSGYRVVYARMLDEPASAVKAAVRGVPVDQLDERDRARRLREVLAEALVVGGGLVVVLDQFEEFFIRQGGDMRRAFARELAECLWPPSNEAALELRLVLSLRDDYLGALDEMTGVLPQDVFAHRYKLEALSRDKALLAILKPAEAFGLPIEEDLREQLITDLEDEGLEAANLQIVLYQLYHDAVKSGAWSPAERRGEGLRLERYRALGGTHKILTDYLDEVIQGLPEVEQQEQARAILKSLVTARKTKAAVSRREIGVSSLVARLGLPAEKVDRLLAYLRDRRVVRKFGEEDRYELAHEVMVATVGKWISREEVRLLDVGDMLRRELTTFEQSGDLLSANQLEQVNACRTDLSLTEHELNLVFGSAIKLRYEAAYWAVRAREAGVPVDDIVRSRLDSPSFHDRAAAVAVLGQFGEQYSEALIRMLDDEYPPVRVTAIQTLEKLQPQGEWRSHLKSECYVPAGAFEMQAAEGEVTVEAFYIGKYPVTNADYKRYMDDIGRAFNFPPEKANHPVVNISWFNARDYAEWAGMRLLTEAEWEKAASWDETARLKREYPWGDEFDRNKCNTWDARLQTTTPVGQYSPDGDSPYGVADIVGNVKEWCNTLWKEGPYRADDGRESRESDITETRVLRGGSFLDDDASCMVRYDDAPDRAWNDFGFRCGWSAQ